VQFQCWRQTSIDYVLPAKGRHKLYVFGISCIIVPHPHH
jgi:hypothetical protein